MSSSQRFIDYSTPRNSTLVKPHCERDRKYIDGTNNTNKDYFETESWND